MFSSSETPSIYVYDFLFFPMKLLLIYPLFRWDCKLVFISPRCLPLQTTLGLGSWRWVKFTFPKLVHCFFLKASVWPHYNSGNVVVVETAPVLNALLSSTTLWRFYINYANVLVLATGSRCDKNLTFAITFWAIMWWCESIYVCYE